MLRKLAVAVALLVLSAASGAALDPPMDCSQFNFQSCVYTWHPALDCCVGYSTNPLQSCPYICEE